MDLDRLARGDAGVVDSLDQEQGALDLLQVGDGRELAQRLRFLVGVAVLGDAQGAPVGRGVPEERFEARDGHRRRPRVEGAREHRHADEGGVAAVAAARDADLGSIAAPRRLLSPVAARVFDVGDHVEALAPVVGVEPALAVAIAAADVGLNVDEARVHEDLGVGAEARGGLALRAAVKGHDHGAGLAGDRGLGGAPWGIAHPHRHLRAVPSRVALEPRHREVREIDLRGARQHPLREGLRLPVVDVARARRASALHPHRHEASIAARGPEGHLVGPLHLGKADRLQGPGVEHAQAARSAVVHGVVDAAPRAVDLEGRDVHGHLGGHGREVALAEAIEPPPLAELVGQHDQLAGVGGVGGAVFHGLALADEGPQRLRRGAPFEVLRAQGPRGLCEQERHFSRLLAIVRDVPEARLGEHDLVLAGHEVGAMDGVVVGLEIVGPEPHRASVVLQEAVEGA